LTDLLQERSGCRLAIEAAEKEQDFPQSPANHIGTEALEEGLRKAELRALRAT
jgi:hypothetical protein